MLDSIFGVLSPEEMKKREEEDAKKLKKYTDAERKQIYQKQLKEAAKKRRDVQRLLA